MKLSSPKPNPSRCNRLLGEVVWFIGMFLLIFGARSTLADHYVVPTGSMEYTLMPGDRVFVDKRAYGLRIPFSQIEIRDGDDVERGEVVIFDSPTDGTRLIKRIVATGGDRVEIREGHLLINGVRASIDTEPAMESLGQRVFKLNLSHGGGPDYLTVVPDDYVLAVGDHRGNSRDGRMFGFVPESAIYGKAIAVYYRRGEGPKWLAL